jgi:hypothetical protein
MTKEERALLEEVARFIVSGWGEDEKGRIPEKISAFGAGRAMRVRVRLEDLWEKKEPV